MGNGVPGTGAPGMRDPHPRGVSGGPGVRLLPSVTSRGLNLSVPNANGGVPEQAGVGVPAMADDLPLDPTTYTVYVGIS